MIAECSISQITGINHKTSISQQLRKVNLGMQVSWLRIQFNEKKEWMQKHIRLYYSQTETRWCLKYSTVLLYLQVETCNNLDNDWWNTYSHMLYFLIKHRIHTVLSEKKKKERKWQFKLLNKRRKETSKSRPDLWERIQ